ncbi:hypothetical protein GCM10009665_39160 [Kitasatospora nipponensis]|uniref:Excreted virulence factor EspC (Type VII ESX diderm) n=2 Tax=Kitasatospora nipponensis TaxID=258049 RepID=A0ABN1WEP5_9ACTN
MLAQVRTALAAVQVPAGAFGHLPDSDQLHTAYNEHATAEQQNLTDLMDLLSYAATGLHSTAGNYRTNESDLQASLGGGR